MLGVVVIWANGHFLESGKCYGIFKINMDDLFTAINSLYVYISGIIHTSAYIMYIQLYTLFTYILYIQFCFESVVSGL